MFVICRGVGGGGVGLRLGVVALCGAVSVLLPWPAAAAHRDVAPPSVTIYSLTTSGDCACAGWVLGVADYGLDATVNVEYGLTPQLGSESESVSVPGAGGETVRWVTISGGLVPGQTYFFQFVAISSAGTSRTTLATFTVPAATPPP